MNKFFIFKNGHRGRIARDIEGETVGIIKMSEVIVSCARRRSQSKRTPHESEDNNLIRKIKSRMDSLQPLTPSIEFKINKMCDQLCKL